MKNRIYFKGVFWVLLFVLSTACKFTVEPDGEIRDIEPMAAVEPCPVEATPEQANVDQATKRLRTKRLGQLRTTTLVVIHREQWVTRKGSEAAAIAFVKKITDNIAARKLAKYNVVDEFQFIISRPGEFTKTGTTSAYNAQLRKNYTRARADKILFVGWGNNGGIAVQNGGAMPGGNYASVIITDGNAPGDYQENDVNHELGHLDGVPHSHQYIHTVDGLTGQALDNYGQVYFPNHAGALKGADVNNPKVGAKYAKKSGSSYEASAGLPYSLDWHPYHVALYLDALSSKPYGIYNTAENVRYESGAIKYDDQFHGMETYVARIGSFKSGRWTWGEWTVFPESAGDVATPIALTRTYSSSGNTGYRYEFGQFDYIKAVVDPGVEWLCSWGLPDSGAKPFPKDGIFRLPASVKYLQLRPATSKTAKPVSVTGYRKSVLQVRELPVKLPAGIYQAEVRNSKGGYSVSSSQFTVK